MTVATFDTLKFANTLKAAGVPDKQAEAQAAAFADVIQANFKELATKDDLKLAKEDVERRIDDTRKELKQEMKDLEQRLGTRTDSIDSNVKMVEAKLRGELVLLKWMIGVGLAMGAAILVRLFVYGGMR